MRPRPKTTWVWVDSLRRSTCRGGRCGASITFATNVRTGKPMPFNTPLVGLDSRMVEEKPGKWRQAQLVDLAGAHFGTCPDVKRFNTPRLVGFR